MKLSFPGGKIDSLPERKPAVTLIEGSSQTDEKGDTIRDKRTNDICRTFAEVHRHRLAIQMHIKVLDPYLTLENGCVEIASGRKQHPHLSPSGPWAAGANRCFLLGWNNAAKALSSVMSESEQASLWANLHSLYHCWENKRKIWKEKTTSKINKGEGDFNTLGVMPHGLFCRGKILVLLHGYRRNPQELPSGKAMSKFRYVLGPSVNS